MISDAVFQGRDILLLEDESLLRKRLQRFLEKAGAEVYAARTMKEARRLISEITVDGALLDIHLRDGEGLDLLRENLPPETACVIIVWTDATDLEFENLRPANSLVDSSIEEGPTQGKAAHEDWLQANWQFPESGFQLEEAMIRLIRLAMDQSGKMFQPQRDCLA